MAGSRNLLQSASVLELIDKIAEVYLSNRWVNTKANYNELATLIWCFSLLDQTYERFSKLWTEMRAALEHFSQHSAANLLKPGLNMKSTILIAKNLVLLDQISLHYPHFFLLLQHFVRSDNFSSQMLDINFKNFTDLMFAFAHMDVYLDKITDWEEKILDVFCQKLAQLDKRNKIVENTPSIIKCMLSIKLVNVGNTEDFWQPLVDILISSLK